jgi:hypothetical protein
MDKAFIWQEVKKIVSSYPLLECDHCAISVSKWLKQYEIPHKIIRLKTKRRNDCFIVSRRYGIRDAITENGVHYGVEVFDFVFDNLSEYGLCREDWIADFSCRSGQFIVDELDYLGD